MYEYCFHILDKKWNDFFAHQHEDKSFMFVWLKEIVTKASAKSVSVTK